MNKMEDDLEGEDGNLNFAPINVGEGGYIGTGPLGVGGSGGFSSSAGQNLGNVPQANNSGVNWGSIVGALSTTTISLHKSIPKTDIEYVIVQTDGSCLELVEQSKLTGRELINLCKFFNVVNAMNGISVNWTDLIYALGIERHFQPGLSDHKHYDTTRDTLFIFLFDAK